MSHASLVQLVIDCLYQSKQALTIREIARRLLNDRLIINVTLEGLIERLNVALEMESQTRGEVARLRKRDNYYELLDTGSFAVVPNTQPPHDTKEDKVNSSPPLDKTSHQAPIIHLELLIRNYPQIRHVVSLLNLSHGERDRLIESLRKNLRKLQRQEKSQGVGGESILDIENWIKTNLTGGSASLAKRLWEGSGRLLIPEHFEACWDMIEGYQLMRVAEDGCCRVTQQGMALMGHGYDLSTSEHGQALLRQLDEQEGLLSLLKLCLVHSQVSEEELLRYWKKELRQQGYRKSNQWLTIALKSRLHHLNDRGLILKKQGLWQLSEEGLSWLRQGGISAPSADRIALEKIWAALKEQREIARQSIASLLDQMDPLHFETLVCELLESMGYDDIHLTPVQQDMGVDVIANIELGITSVREVVQVKRQHRAIHRPVLDALRGSLHRFDAVRDTLITTSTFSKGTREAAFERGASPVTLIDGERLIDLLMEHGIGVKPIQIKLWQVDPYIFEEGSNRAWPRWIFNPSK